MWFLGFRRPEIAVIKYLIGKLVPFSYVQVISAHQGILPETLMFRIYKFLGESEKYKNFTVNPGSFQVLCEKLLNQYGLGLDGKENNFQANETAHQLEHKMKAMPLSELLQFILYLSDSKRSNRRKVLLRTIDKVCSEKIPSMSIVDALRVNYCWLGLYGTKIKFLKSFGALLNSYTNVLRTNIQVTVVIPILFFSGVARKHRKAKEIVSLGLTCIFNNENQILGLSDVDMVIVSEVAFKTGVKIKNSIFFDHLIKIVSADIFQLASDTAHVVVVVKTLRHNQIHERNFLKNMQKCLIENNQILNSYNFPVITHLIALYADALHSDLKFINVLIAAAVASLNDQDVYNPRNEKGKGRAKDLARLLWAAGYLGIKISENTVEEIILPIIEEKITSGAYRTQLSVFIDTMLSLWIMGYKPVNLLPHIFTEEIKTYLQETYRVRYKKRLQLLSTCISIEAPEAMLSVNLQNFNLVSPEIFVGERKLKRRPIFRKVLRDMKSAVLLLDGINIAYENSLPFLTIPGIVLSTTGEERRNLLNIEVLDTSNCLHDSEIPNGLMLLKLRLLSKLGHRFILIKGSEYENQKTQIMLQIEEEIKKAK